MHFVSIIRLLTETRRVLGVSEVVHMLYCVLCKMYAMVSMMERVLWQY